MQYSYVLGWWIRIQAETWWRGVPLLQVTVQQVLSCSEASCGLSCGAVWCEDFSSSSCSVYSSLFSIILHKKTSRGWNSAVKQSSVIRFKPARLWPNQVLYNLILAKHSVPQRTAQQKPLQSQHLLSWLILEAGLISLFTCEVTSADTEIASECWRR